MKLDTIRTLYPTVKIEQVLNYLPTRNVVYVTNPKAGCSTVKLMLFKVHTGDFEMDPQNVHAIHPLPRPNEIGWDNIDGLLSGGAFLFTFVRDPVGRALSAYSDKVVRQKFKYCHLIQHTLGRAEDPHDPVSFEDFVTALEIQRPEEMDQHWRHQHINVMHDAIRYDRIGRLENFDADWSVICAVTGIPNVSIVHRNKQPSKAVIDAALAKRLRKVYEQDCDLFGY